MALRCLGNVDVAFRAETRLHLVAQLGFGLFYCLVVFRLRVVAASFGVHFCGAGRRMIFIASLFRVVVVAI